MRVRVCLLALVAIAGCKQPVSGYCSEQADCDEPDRPYCDQNGTYAESEFIGNTCIPFPANTEKSFCLVDADCPSDEPFCTDARECRGCDTNAECSARDATTPYCDPGGSCLACEPGAFIRCDGDDSVRCADDGGGEESVACLTTCSATEGRCLDCSPGEFLGCDPKDATQLIACGNDGTSQVRTSCGYACNETEERCDDCNPAVANTCDPSSGQHVECNSDGQVVTAETCGLGCDTAGELCETCTSGEFLRCPDANTIATCGSDGASETTMTCDAGLSCDPDGQECNTCDGSRPTTTDEYVGLACSGDSYDCCGLVSTGTYGCINSAGSSGFCASRCAADADCGDYSGIGNIKCIISVGGPAEFCGFQCTDLADCPPGFSTCSGNTCMP